MNAACGGTEKGDMQEVMSGTDGRVRLYLADIRPLFTAEIWQKAYGYVDEGRRKKVDACRTVQMKAASLAAGFLAQYALDQSGYADCRILYGEKGQPFLQKKDRVEKEPPACLSLSHSGDYAVCAVSDRPVGVDIQKRTAVRTGMLRHFFTEDECGRFVRRFETEQTRADWGGSALSKDPAQGRSSFLPEAAAEEFLRLWTAKESYMKLTGRGMEIGFSNLSVDLEGGVIRERNGRQEPCFIREYKAPEGYFLTACIAGRRREEQGKNALPLEGGEE